MIIEDQAREEILTILNKHTGHNVRVSRVELLQRINFRLSIVMPADRNYVSDRLMRNLIEELRTKTTAGSMICSSLDGGYFMAADLEELETYLATEEGRAKSLLKRTRNQRKHAIESKIGEQESLF